MKKASLLDVPKDGAGPAAPPPSPPEPAVFKSCVASRVGVCLHYERHGVYIRENLTVEKCRERIEALAHSDDAVALWTWKLEKIEQNKPS